MKGFFKRGDWKDILFAIIIFPILTVIFYVIFPWAVLFFFMAKYAILGFITLSTLFILSIVISMYIRWFFGDRKLKIENE